MSDKKDIILPGQESRPVDDDSSILLKPENRPSAINYRMIEKDGRRHTMLIGLKHILPEDIIWRRTNEMVPAMICLQENNSCDCPFNCMPKLAKRCGYLFDEFRHLHQIIIIFQREEKPLNRRQPKKEYLSGMGNDFEVKTKVPRLFAVHITTDFNIRVMRSNFDGLQVAMKRTEESQLDVPLSFWS